MARYFKLYALSIILLVIVQDSVALKNKKEYKKVKDLKGKGKYEEVFAEEGKNRQSKQFHSHNQHNSQRSVRSIKDSKVRVTLEEPSEERIHYTNGKKLMKPQTEEILISKKFENSCGKKHDCGGNMEKQKRKVAHLVFDETSGKGRLSPGKKGKVNKSKHVHLDVEGIESELESVPEDFEYRVCGRRIQKEKKIPAYLVFEDSGSEVIIDEHENRYTPKTLRHLAHKFIIDSENESDSEKTNEDYFNSSDDFIRENSYSGSNDTEEEYEEDFL